MNVVKISEEQLEYLIKREFPDHTEEVTNKLNQVVSDSDAGKRRISSAILKLADGDIKELDKQIAAATIDFRDVVSAAEYKRHSNLGFGSHTNEQAIEANEKDWHEYQSWLNG